MSTITVFPARKVVTMDPDRPVAEAVAVMDGKVLSTGSLSSMQPWLSRHGHVIDHTLEDKIILPGFIDPHTHFRCLRACSEWSTSDRSNRRAPQV